MKAIDTAGRETWIDWMRIVACFMVMVVHSAEPFYLGGDGSLVLTEADAFWVSLIDSFVRACVPLFVIASSYLQFPVHYDTGEFFRRRAVRILIPFVIWSFIYVSISATPAANLKDLVFNFNYSAGHLWFVYMLVGIYVLMPLLSPWAEKVGRKELQIYLGIWAFTLLIPFVRDYMRDGLTVVYGPSGLPFDANWPLWGEASWNHYGMFYYFSGFIGYLLLGLWFRKFAGEYSWKRTLLEAVPCWGVGFYIAFAGFFRRICDSALGSFPVEGRVDMAVGWETSIGYDTLGVALMSIGWVLVFRKIRSSGRFYEKVIKPVSDASYGMYLCHIIILLFFSNLFRTVFGTGAQSAFGSITRPVEMLLTAVCTFLTAAASCVIVRRIPKIGKYLVG